MTTLIAAIGCVAWLYLLAVRGGFWRVSERDDEPAAVRALDAWPRVTAIVPARDEADVIGANLASLLLQDYPGDFSVIVVDDHSSDATAAVARASGGGATPSRVTVLRAPALEPGWTGKLSALDHGIRHAEARPAPSDYLLLTDADIAHAPDTLRMLVSRARREGLLLSSLMAKLNAQSGAERAMIPAFVFFFRMLYPFAWVNSLRRTSAAAAGGCMLVDRNALHRAGGLAAIRGELIDDCALARLLKPHGPIRIALTDRVRSMRAYRSFGELRRMIARTAFTQLRCSPGRLGATVAAMLVVFVAPPVFALTSADPLVRALGAFAWGCMTLAFVPMLAFYRRSPAWAVALPAIAAAYVALTIDSAFQHLRGRGGEWKGRVRPRAAFDPAGRP
jgi:hopene-associated glycosyltransferase HpnB